MTTGERAPDPREARNPAEFIARLQALKDRSGLTYRELSARAEAGGDVLPRSTVANMLARTTVPREELLAAFVRACGVPPERAQEWETVRAELAVRGRHGGGPDRPAGPGGPGDGAPDGADAFRTAAPEAGPDELRTGTSDGPDGPPADTDGPPADTDGPPAGGLGGPAAGVLDGLSAGAPDGPPAGGPDGPHPLPAGAPAWPAAEEEPEEPDPEPPSRWRRALVGAVAVAGLVLATVSVVAFVRDDPRPGRAHRPVLTAPAEGAVHIRVIGSDLCLNERRGSRDGQIYQRACAGADVPRYELKRLGGDRWRIVSVHPDFPVGCSGIPSGGRIPYAALEDSECGDPTRVERFTLEPHGTPVTGYRIVPADSATPGSCVTVVGDRMAEWSRLTQAPCTADARGQLFSFDRR
ncbi:helix-turn-helix domain-containing protein [Streptomyces sp. NPDC092046]|uniref:helix-turn-helix domain-containing protein n=1 Tax=Streptomyces sp. NPDC092046 TaxID=3366009 RepID=UPI00381742A8